MASSLLEELVSNLIEFILENCMLKSLTPFFFNPSIVKHTLPISEMVSLLNYSSLVVDSWRSSNSFSIDLSQSLSYSISFITESTRLDIFLFTFRRSVLALVESFLHHSVSSRTYPMLENVLELYVAKTSTAGYSKRSMQ